MDKQQFEEDNYNQPDQQIIMMHRNLVRLTVKGIRIITIHMVALILMEIIPGMVSMENMISIETFSLKKRNLIFSKKQGRYLQKLVLQQ